MCFGEIFIKIFLKKGNLENVTEAQEVFNRARTVPTLGVPDGKISV